MWLFFYGFKRMRPTAVSATLRFWSRVSPPSVIFMMFHKGTASSSSLLPAPHSGHDSIWLPRVKYEIVQRVCTCLQRRSSWLGISHSRNTQLIEKRKRFSGVDISSWITRINCVCYSAISVLTYLSVSVFAFRRNF